jgi:ABC-2 type transport system ATP-binding protein
MTMLDVSGLSFSYDGVTPVLHDVSLRVEDGTIVGLIGPNGSGKSTLIKNLLDLLRLQSGTVTVAGHPHSSTAAHASAAYLASNDYLPQFLTAREYIHTLAKLYGARVDDDDARELFARFSMEGRYDDLIEDFSHGMRKKTQLVSGLVLRRSFTVIDETLNGIDVEALHLAEQQLRALREEGRSILLCTHDFPVLERLADRIVFLDLGQVVAEGATSELVAEHGSLADLVFDWLDADLRTS